MSSRVLTELENIDDDAENKDIVMVKIDIDLDDKHILEKLNIPNTLPKLALFEDGQPAQLFEGKYFYLSHKSLLQPLCLLQFLAREA